MQHFDQPYRQLPKSVPHPAVCRPAMRRGFIGLFTALLSVSIVLGLARASRASPCAVARVDDAVIARGLARLARPERVASPSGWHRLGALLPRRVAWSSSQRSSEGAGWYLGLDGGVSERALWSDSGGWSVGLIWDLRPLWRPVQPHPLQRWRDPLHRAEQLERLAGRLAHRLERLATLAQRAAAPDLQPGACARLQIQARATVMAVRAALIAGDRVDLRPPPIAPRAPPVARPAPPDRGPLPSPRPGRAGSGRFDGQ